MKKYIFIFAALFLGLSQVSAQEIYVDNFTAPVGSVQKFDVKYRGIEGKTIQGYIFKFEFPEGLSLVTNEDGEAVYEYGDGNTKFDVKTTATGVQASPSSKTSQLSGSEGTLLTMTLQVNNPLVLGDIATVKVYDASLTEKVVNEDTGLPSYNDLNTDPFTFEVEIVEDRVIFDETATKLPAFTAGQKKNIRMNRTLKGGQWSTMVFPFPLSPANAKKVFGDDVKFAEFSGFKTTVDEETLTPTAIEIKFATKTPTALAPIAAGKAYLVKPVNDVTTFDLDNVSLSDAVTDQSKDDDTYADVIHATMKGSFVKTVVPADGLFISSEKFYYSTGKTNIKAFRAWFESNAIVNKALDVESKITFTVDGEATSVDGIPSYQRVVEGVYDLSGRKIKLENGDVTKLQKGVYIIDGKKVTIK
ncbi:MAG: hypothetical protein J5770_02795 [Bacteroidaceae bacterium]|nr:hypothetical protein [Bacteroidaceae bacterium]